MTAQAVPKSVSQLVGGADWVVHTGGLGTHTTLASAISAASSNDTIVVASDLTITAPIQINRPLNIVFQDVTITNAATSSGVDTIKTSVTDGQAGEVADVRLMGRLKCVRSGSGKAGKAINFHGAYQWVVDDLTVSDHAAAVYFDASPYPSGQCSKNTVRSLYAQSCTVGIHNTSSANINQVWDAHTYSCTTDVWVESGLNFNVFGLRMENTVGAQTSPRIIVDGGSASFYGVHGEVGPADPVLDFNGGYVFFDGDVYGGTGDGGSTQGTKLDPTGASGWWVKLRDGRPARMAANDMCIPLPSISATTTVTVFRAFNTCTIREWRLHNNGFINYDASNYWTVTAEEYNGNVDVGAINTVTQSAQIGLGQFGATGLSYALAENRLMRLIFTKTGSPTSWTNPLLWLRWDTA